MARSSLPHTDPSQALHLLRKTMPLLVTWPRLPERSFLEEMEVQSASNFPGLVVDSVSHQMYVDQETAERDLDRISLAYLRGDHTTGEITSTYAAGLHTLLNLPRIEFSGQAITSYLMGPVSLSLYLTDEQQRPLVYNPVLLEAVTQHLVMRVAWLSAQLAELTENIIVCLDEPFLDAFHSSFLPIEWEYAIELLEEVLANIQGCGGLILHQDSMPPESEAASVAWAHLLDTSVELLIFPMGQEQTLTLLPQFATLLPPFLERNGALAWGICPAAAADRSSEPVAALATRLGYLLDTLQQCGLSPDQVLQSSFITTSTGLAHLPVAGAAQALQRCAELSEHLRLKYGLTDTRSEM